MCSLCRSGKKRMHGCRAGQGRSGWSTCVGTWGCSVVRPAGKARAVQLFGCRVALETHSPWARGHRCCFCRDGDWEASCALEQWRAPCVTHFHPFSHRFTHFEGGVALGAFPGNYSRTAVQGFPLMCADRRTRLLVPIGPPSNRQPPTASVALQPPSPTTAAGNPPQPALSRTRGPKGCVAHLWHPKCNSLTHTNAPPRPEGADPCARGRPASETGRALNTWFWGWSVGRLGVLSLGVGGLIYTFLGVKHTHTLSPPPAPSAPSQRMSSSGTRVQRRPLGPRVRERVRVPSLPAAHNTTRGPYSVACTA